MIGTPGCRGGTPAVMAHGCAALLCALERVRCGLRLVYITTPDDRFLFASAMQELPVFENRDLVGLAGRKGYLL